MKNKLYYNKLSLVKWNILMYIPVKRLRREE